MPALDPGPSLPKPYFILSKDRVTTSTLVNDPDTERTKTAALKSIAATLPPPPELSRKTGLPLTKAEKKAVGVPNCRNYVSALTVVARR